MKEEKLKQLKKYIRDLLTEFKNTTIHDKEEKEKYAEQVVHRIIKKAEKVL